jgi:cytochrome c553
MRTLLAILLAFGFSASVYAKGNAEAGKAKAAQVCAACHGPEGNKPSDPTQPILAGQYYDYLVRALTDYKISRRNNPIMKGFAASQKSNLHDQR